MAIQGREAIPALLLVNDPLRNIHGAITFLCRNMSEELSAQKAEPTRHTQEQ
jgi:hypothetical protein